MTAPIRFGTDGVRGAAGTWPITKEGATTIGRGVGAWTQGGVVYIGHDTRESSAVLVDAAVDGAAGMVFVIPMMGCTGFWLCFAGWYYAVNGIETVE